MSKIIAVVAMLFAFLTGCATDATVRTHVSELSGTYYSGDGLGRLVYITLRPDGTFASDWQGCLGVYGEATGSWQLQGDQIIFNPAAERDALAGYLRRATTIRHDGRIGFARTQDVAHDKIRQDLVFFKQDGGAY
ncbi:hypothetical protein [Pseudoxanthomonas mexicana]|uniref:hypothetical protein n=2 Tax=Pseudoxanthomonas mexicana TaxID=128785 RepID=UPI0028A02D26|nr:hypothetical protein [Pseudoxanthomonas mexicana]